MTTNYSGFSLLIKFFQTSKHMSRSSHPEVFYEKGVLKICSKFTGEQPCRLLLHGCSPVNLLHIFRTPFPRNTSGRLLLYVPRSQQ